MKTIVLLSCAKEKCDFRTQAHLLYISVLFKKSLAFARRMNPSAIYILSAKHGLLELEKKIAPYQLTLNSMSPPEVKNWSKRVLAQLRSRTDLTKDRFVFLTGKRYSRYLIPQMANAEAPLKGLGTGYRLQFLTRN